MSVRVPPGWPGAVHPPGAEDFEATAVAWLLDQCPPEYRGHRILRMHPRALSTLALHHLRASLDGVRTATGRARAELADAVPPGATEAVLEALSAQEVHLLATGRAARLVHDALAGQRYVPRL